MRLGVVVFLIVLTGFSTGIIEGAPARGSIIGQIGIVRGNGDVVPGARVPLWIHSRGIDIKALVLKHPAAVLSPDTSLGKISILTLQLEFLRILGSAEYTKYMVGTATANLYGEFEFPNLVQPRWYYLTALYQSELSAAVWHLPVLLDRYSKELELSNDNVALPVYNR